MASEETLDFEKLLAPIAGDNPSGPDLKYDPVYSEIRAARRGDDDTDPDPVKIERIATEVLSTRSKDLQLAAYLTEALVQTGGFAGMRDGFRLMTQLMQKYWDSVNPLPDESAAEGERLEARAGSLSYLTDGDRGALIPNRLSLTPLVPSTNGVVYSIDFYNQRQVPPARSDEVESAYEQRVAAGEAKAKEFDDALAKASTDRLQNVIEDIDACLENVASFESVANEYLGADKAPGTSALRKPLEECRYIIHRALKEREPVVDSETGTVAGESDGQREGGVAKGPIQTREAALQRLAEVAAYFRRAEPHSPVSYLVERAASWGRMPFAELLPELIKDSSAREQIKELLALSDGETKEG